MKIIVALLIGIVSSATLSTGWMYAAAGTDLSRTVSGAGVTVKVTYLAHASDDLRFSVAMDTHSVNLDGYDLKGLSFVRDDTGAVMQAVEVKNKGGGHHCEVILVFPRALGDWKWLEVVIKDVAGVKERTFRWDRK